MRIEVQIFGEDYTECVQIICNQKKFFDHGWFKKKKEEEKNNAFFLELLYFLSLLDELNLWRRKLFQLFLHLWKKYQRNYSKNEKKTKMRKKFKFFSFTLIFSDLFTSMFSGSMISKTSIKNKDCQIIYVDMNEKIENTLKT